MIEALWYGLVASLCFIGFVSLVYFLLLHIYNPKKSGKHILFVSENNSQEEIENLLYGAHIRNVIYGALICEDILLLDNNLSDEIKSLIDSLSKNYGGIKYVKPQEIVDLFNRKE